MTITALPASGAGVRTRPAAVADLLDRNVRDQYQLAYWPGLGYMAVHEHAVLANPRHVSWLTVTSAVVDGGAVAYTATMPDGTVLTFRDTVDWPIVLGQPT